MEVHNCVGVFGAFCYNSPISMNSDIHLCFPCATHLSVGKKRASDIRNV